MNRHQVASSNISSIGYDSATQTLEVEFHNGSVYQYYGVSESLHQQIMQASSKGTISAPIHKKRLSLLSSWLKGCVLPLRVPLTPYLPRVGPGAAITLVGRGYLRLLEVPYSSLLSLQMNLPANSSQFSPLRLT